MTLIHLLGSEGFIGQSLQRAAEDNPLRCWSHHHTNRENHFDLLDPSSWQALVDCNPTHVILLSWPGLPNYQQPFHLTHNLPACINLIEQLVASGMQRLVVAGTCYEYGLQNGQLNEQQYTDPINCYSIAKDSLRRFIASRYKKEDLQWCWARIFYPFGIGQNENSLLPSLQRAINHKKPRFEMSSGRQLRDYIPVDEVSRILLTLIKNPHANGIYNCGSGLPVSLRELAEKKITESGSATNLELGVYPDRLDEPLAFWADTTKFNSLI